MGMEEPSAENISNLNMKEIAQKFDDINNKHGQKVYDLVNEAFKIFTTLPRTNPMFVNPGYAKNTVKFVKKLAKQKLNLEGKEPMDDSVIKWKVTLYIYYGDTHNFKYEISISCQYLLNQNDVYYFIDRYGNFYLSKEMFLSPLEFDTYFTHENMSTPQNVAFRDTFYTATTNGFAEYFGNNAISLKFKNLPEYMFMQIKIMYPLLNILSQPNLPNINIFEKDKRLHYEIGAWQDRTFFTERLDYERFDYFRKYVENRACIRNGFYTASEELFFIRNSGFSVTCQQKLEKIKKDRYISWDTERQFEEYKWNINKKTENGDILLACHILAHELFKKYPSKSPIKLSQFKYVIYWFIYKITSKWKTLESDQEGNILNIITGSESCVLFFVEQFKNLLDEVENIYSEIFFQEFLHKFTSIYSEIYHLTLHYNSVYEAICNMKATPSIKTSFEYLIENSKALQSEINFCSHHTSDIGLISNLSKCVKFYLYFIPKFVFQQFSEPGQRYYLEKHTEDNGFCSVYYFASLLFGIKSVRKNVECNILTIYTTAKKDEDILKEEESRE